MISKEGNIYLNIKVSDKNLQSTVVNNIIVNKNICTLNYTRNKNSHTDWVLYVKLSQLRAYIKAMTTLNDDGQSIWIVTSKNICHCKNQMKIFMKMP